MRATRRYWATAALGVVLAALGVVSTRPVLLIGAAGVGAWLLAREYAFYRSLARTFGGLEVDQDVSTTHVATDEPLSATLAVRLGDPSSLSVTVEAVPPVGTADSTDVERAVTIDPGERSAATDFVVSFPLAGAFAFDSPRVTATDPAGLLSESVRRGSAPSVVVEPRTPRNVHVGEGGERIAAAFGEHAAGRIGAGIEFAEVREYVPGDAASRIDWKATARLNHPHVREYEAETDRRTVLLVDGRAAMGVGPPDETKLDYLRGIALSFLNTARDLDDPLGLYAIGDEGVTVEVHPATAPGTYAAVRRRLHELRPTDPAAAISRGRPGRSPADVRRAAARLADDGSAFGTTLHPYLADAAPYVERIEGDPLFGAVRAYVARQRGTVWTVLFTDDTDPAGVREAVKLARRGDDHVLVFLAPDALFEPGGLADVEAAYDRYVEFEEFRRELGRLDRVSAFEVAPGDRLDAVLAGHRRRRDRPRARGT